MYLEWLNTAYNWLFNGNFTLLLAFGISAMLLVSTGVLCCFLRNMGLYFAIAVLAVAGILGVCAWQKIVLHTTLPVFVLLTAVGGVGYILTVVSFYICEQVRKNRARTAEEARKLQFATGEDNSFVRARLNALCAENEGNTLLEGGDEVKLRFAYARKLLARLRSAPLSVAEKLEVEEMDKIFGVYKQKENFISEDVRLISETFSRVLKLSAKYGV